MFFKIFTFGCKVNQYESEFIRRLLTDAGYEYCEDNSLCNIFVVNSCTVTAVSDKKCRQLLHKLRRTNPQAVVLLCGCMSQAHPNKTEDFNDCDIVIGNTDHTCIPLLLDEFFKSSKRIIKIENHDRKSEKFEKCCVSNFSERTRAYMKIEDGCSRFCSYCIIPYARGRVRSKALDDIKEEAETLASNGYKEIVLTGINLSLYGTDIDCNLCDAVKAVSLAKGIERIRLGSLEPEYLSEDVIKRLSGIKSLCPQFHLSLQSGCDTTLSSMNRRYTTKEYMTIVDNLRKYFSNCSVTTDVMVGFAGETEEDFNDSLNFVSSVGFSKVHVFPYSRREGTKAYDMKNQLTNKIKAYRATVMAKACDASRESFLRTQIGNVPDVLFETLEDGYYFGYTPNYTPVYVKSLEDLRCGIYKVNLTSLYKDGCEGVIV